MSNSDNMSLGSAMAAYAYTFPLSAYNSFVIFKFYGWFVIPLGAPTLIFWHVWGLVLLYSLITYKPAATGNLWHRLLEWTIVITVLLGLGALIHTAMP